MLALLQCDHREAAHDAQECAQHVGGGDVGHRTEQARRAATDFVRVRRPAEPFPERKQGDDWGDVKVALLLLFLGALVLGRPCAVFPPERTVAQRRQREWRGAASFGEGDLSSSSAENSRDDR
jgi:hypothetical protein